MIVFILALGGYGQSVHHLRGYGAVIYCQDLQQVVAPAEFKGDFPVLLRLVFNGLGGIVKRVADELPYIGRVHKGERAAVGNV